MSYSGTSGNVGPLCKIIMKELSVIGGGVMKTWHSILLGVMAYFMSSVISKVTGINEIILVLWFSTIVGAISLFINKEKGISKADFYIALVVGVTAFGTTIFYALEFLGFKLEHWL